MNFVMAESAFIRSLDYPGIQFIKKLQGISKEELKKAVIAAYFKKYDEAEKIFLESDRRYDKKKKFLKELRFRCFQGFGVKPAPNFGRLVPRRAGHENEYTRQRYTVRKRLERDRLLFLPPAELVNVSHGNFALLHFVF